MEDLFDLILQQNLEMLYKKSDKDCNLTGYLITLTNKRFLIYSAQAGGIYLQKDTLIKKRAFLDCIIKPEILGSLMQASTNNKMENVIVLICSEEIDVDIPLTIEEDKISKVTKKVSKESLYKEELKENIRVIFIDTKWGRNSYLFDKLCQNII